MEGYEVVTSDDATVGRVVSVAGDYLVVEHGTLRKTRNALPLELAHADEDARVVRATVSKEMLHGAPEVDEAGPVDARAVAAYYGVGEAVQTPASVREQDTSVEGYEVRAGDESAVGEAVGVAGDRYVLVQHGGLRKRTTAVPLAFAQIDHDARVVRATVSKERLLDGPDVSDGADFDPVPVAAYYGLAEGFDAPSSEGYGETLPDDPGLSADEDAHRLGVRTADQERLAARRNMRPEGQPPVPDTPGRQIHPDRWGD